MVKVSPDPANTTNKAGKSKERRKKRGRYKLKLKGWLKTPADWARFDAWANVNSQPRKIPEPEPVIRTSKPLWKMKKRIEVLSQPTEKPDPSLMYRFDQSVSKKALKAKASKRLKIIARPVMKAVVMPREFPLKIKKSALQYKATENITKISQPRDFRSEECKNMAEVLREMEVHMESMDGEEKKEYEQQMWPIIKKALTCPDVLTDVQIRRLITEAGVHKTAFTYKATPWMDFLSLPSYRFLRMRSDDIAKSWKEDYLAELETRGKRALEEQFQREERRRKLGAKTIAESDNAQEEEPADAQAPERLEQDGGTPEQALGNDGAPENPEAPGNNDVPQDGVIVSETERMVLEAERNQDESPSIGESETLEEFTDEESQHGRQTEKLYAGTTSVPKGKTRIKSDAKPQRTRFIPRPTPLADDEKSRKRREERNAWRFAPPPWKDEDPTKVKESALKGPVPPGMTKLALPHIHKDTLSRKNPFDVRKSALTGPVPARMTELAKPAHPRDPVERPPPRKRNKYHQPIFPIPPYGKKLPPVPPYKEKECKPAEAESSEEPKNTGKQYYKPDPIVFKPTIDPYFDPQGAQRQLNARKALAETHEQVENEKSKN